MEKISIYLFRRLNIIIIMTFMLMVSIGLWYNLTNQYTNWGTGDGKYADQVDSFSEYIIRNTVLNNIIGTENKGGSLIFTKGYPEEDYNYYPDLTEKYLSNRGSQVIIYEAIANLNKNLFIKYYEKYFEIFRFINSLLVIVCASTFFLSFFGRNSIALFGVFLFSISGGIALFASNLYFTIWCFFTPLLCFPFLQRGYHIIYIFSALLFSLLYFSVRYEFATTFALMWLFPLVVLTLKGKTADLQIGISVFIAVCIGFLIAVFLHLRSVSQEFDVTIREASVYIFRNLRRVASMEDVPFPFSLDFFRWIKQRWVMTGWSLPYLFSITKLFLLIAFLIIMFQGKESKIFPILVWSLIAYVSWYVFGYQHIMWHYPYDSILFASTIQLALIVYIMSKISRLLATLAASHEKKTEEASDHSCRRNASLIDATPVR